MKTLVLRTRKAKAIAAVAAVAVLGTGVFSVVRFQESRYPQVQLTQVTQARLTSSVIAVGDIEARDRNVITLSPAAKVVEVLVGEGERVGRGDVLAILDTSEYASQLEQQQINLSAAESTLDYLSGPNSATNGATSQNAVSQAAVALENARAAEAAARQNLANLPGFADSALTQAELVLQGAILNADAARTNLDSARELNRDAVCQAEIALDVARIAYDKAEHDLAELKQRLVLGQVTQAEYDAQCPVLAFTVDVARNTLHSAHVALESARVSADANVSLAEKAVPDADLAIASAEAARDAAALKSDADRQGAERAVSDAQRAITSAEIALSNAQNAADAAGASDAERTSNQSSQISLLDANIRYLRDKVEQGRLRANVAGVVSRMDAVVNQYPQLGDAIVVEGTYGFVAAVDIDQADSAGIKPGLGATVRVKGIGATFKGTVASVSPVAQTSATAADQHPKLSIDVAILEPDDSVRVGFEADVEVMLDDKAAALQVSTGAVRTDPASGRRYVWMVDDRDRVNKVFIQTGIETANQVEVVSGLVVGQDCVLDPEDTLVEDARVRLA